MTTAAPDELLNLLHARGLTREAVAVLAQVDNATVGRIVSGRTRARPVTIVRLARALGVSPKRLQAMCDASWQAAHDEQVPA